MKVHPFPLKPMTVGNILDYTFHVYRNNFIAILGFSALVAGLYNLLILFLSNRILPQGLATDPVELIQNVIDTGQLESLIVSGYDSGLSLPQMFIYQGVVGLLTFIYSIFILPFVVGGIINITHNYFQGTKFDIPGAFLSTLRKYWNLVLTGLCLSVYYLVLGITVFIISLVIIIPLTIGGMAGGFGGNAWVFLLVLFVMFIFVVALFSILLISFVYPLVISEGVLYFDAIKRSIKLVWKKFWKVLGVYLLGGLLVSFIYLAIMGIALVISYISPIPGLYNYILSILGTALIYPILYILITLLYYDVKMRVEGYDIDIESQMVEGNGA